MYTPLYFAKIMDVKREPNTDKTIGILQKIVEDGGDLMTFMWYDTDFLNPDYHGKYKYVNDFLQKYRSRLYKSLTGDAKIPSDPEQDHALAAEAISSIIMVNHWTQNKQVYSFDPELELSLADTEEIKLPIRVLDRLPYRSFYVDFADNGIFKSNFDGAFINIVPEQNGYIVYTMRVKSDGRSMSGETAMIPKCDEDGIFFFTKDDITCDNGDDRNVDWQIFGFFMLNALLYLCADNRDVIESETTKHTYRPSQTVKNKFSEVRKWECGYRYGNTIRKERKNTVKEDHTAEKGPIEKSQRRRMVTHTRRAHWHHYWTGKRDEGRTLILHWIAPTIINGDKIDTATIHKVL